MSDIKWYSPEEILKIQAQYYLVIGERSNGKSFAFGKHILTEYFEYGKQFSFVKRFDEDIKSKYMKTVFAPLEDWVLETYGKRIKFYHGNWLAYDKDSDGKLSECDIMGYAMSLSSSNRYKATQYPNIDNVLFEEFMSIDCSYLDDEINLLVNLVSTIVRNRITARIYMLANAISKYSPYFQALNIKVHRMEKGKIIKRTYTDSLGYKTTFAIERTENVNVFDNTENVDKVVYNIFGTSGVGKMITSGDFETHSYPHIIEGYTFTENKIIGFKKPIGKKYITPLVLRFEDYYYRVYIVDDYLKYISAFREIEYSSIKEKNTSHVIGGISTMDGITNINNILAFNDENINVLLNILVSTIKQRDFVVQSDDDGENVVNGFRLVGMSYVNN